MSSNDLLFIEKLEALKAQINTLHEFKKQGVLKWADQKTVFDELTRFDYRTITDDNIFLRKVERLKEISGVFWTPTGGGAFTDVMLEKIEIWRFLFESETLHFKHKKTEEQSIDKGQIVSELPKKNKNYFENGIFRLPNRKPLVLTTPQAKSRRPLVEHLSKNMNCWCSGVEIKKETGLNTEEIISAMKNLRKVLQHDCDFSNIEVKKMFLYFTEGPEVHCMLYIP